MKPDDKSYAPLDYYGQTKLEGELAVSSSTDKYFIVRIAWVFGLNGKNFIKTMVNVGRTHDTVRVVRDQIGSPTYCYDLARLLVDMIETEEEYGLSVRQDRSIRGSTGASSREKDSNPSLRGRMQ